jgi:cellobiose phosphorylase
MHILENRKQRVEKQKHSTKLQVFVLVLDNRKCFYGKQICRQRMIKHKENSKTHTLSSFFINGSMFILILEKNLKTTTRQQLSGEPTFAITGRAIDVPSKYFRS